MVNNKDFFLKYFLCGLRVSKLLTTKFCMYQPKFCSLVVLSELKKNFNYFLLQLLYTETNLRYFYIHINNFASQKLFYQGVK